MFYLGGVGLGFFLNLLLLSKGKKTPADRILACWLFIITLHLLFFYFWKERIYPQLLGAAMPLPLVHGPFLYLYTMALTNRGVPVKFAWIHFVPPIAVFLYLTPFFFRPLEQRIFIYEHNGIGYETFGRIKSFLIIASGVAYVVLSMLALRRHRISIFNQYSSTEKISLAWLQYLIYWIGGIWILVIIGNDDWVFAAAVLFILFIGFFGIKQVGVFHSTELVSTAPEILPPAETGSDAFESVVEKRKYQKSGLNTDSSETLHRTLSTAMRNEKYFRESELSLTDLARRLNTQPNYLSQVMNEREGKNFYDYINTLRIEEFMRLVASPDSRKYTLLALAQECGFNSKSSFNRYFKKVTGKSPSEFMQNATD